MTVTILQGGAGVTLQDGGRTGFVAQGISQGGVADRLAWVESAVLLEQALLPVIECMGQGLRLRFDTAGTVSLTGADRPARLGDRPVRWSAAHPVDAGDILTIAAGHGFATVGVSGGFAGPDILGSVSVQQTAGLGTSLADGQVLDTGPMRCLAARLLDPVSSPQVIRVMPGPQTERFDPATRTQFEATVFHRSPQGNRQGVRLDYQGAPFSAPAQLTRVSDFITVGDIQMTGDGVPYVLLADCQTIGGYPRIGTVLPMDLPALVRANSDQGLRFRFVTLDEAAATVAPLQALRTQVAARLRPLVRNPLDIPDLLSYQLLSGFITGDEEWL